MLSAEVEQFSNPQSAFTSSKLTIETVEQGVKYSIVLISL